MIRIGLALITLLAVPLVLQVPALEILKLKVFDRFVVQHEPSEYFTILNITDSDVRAEGGYPLPRARLAEINEEKLQKDADEKLRIENEKKQKLRLRELERKKAKRGGRGGRRGGRGGRK